MNKARVATEWLILLGGLMVGLVGIPIALTRLIPPFPIADFYGSLFGGGRGREVFAAWAFALTPYCLVQIVRSVVWAIRTISRQ